MGALDSSKMKPQKNISKIKLQHFKFAGLIVNINWKNCPVTSQGMKRTFCADQIRGFTPDILSGKVLFPFFENQSLPVHNQHTSSKAYFDLHDGAGLDDDGQGLKEVEDSPYEGRCVVGA